MTVYKNSKVETFSFSGDYIGINYIVNIISSLLDKYTILLVSLSNFYGVYFSS